MVSQDDINLLPPDLRGKEEKFKKERPVKSWEIKMTRPQKKIFHEQEIKPTFWWQQLKKFLTQPLGKGKPSDLIGIPKERRPVFEYEKKPVKPTVKQEMRATIEAVKPKESPKVKPRPSFFAKIFSQPTVPKEKEVLPPILARKTILPQPPFEVAKPPKPVSAPEKKEEKPKRISFWSKIIKPQIPAVKVQSTQRIPPPIPPSQKKEEKPKKISLAKEISFFEKIFGAKKEAKKEAPTARPVKPSLAVSSKKKESQPLLKIKKGKRPTISFIPESEASIKLNLFQKIFLTEVMVLGFCFLIGFAYLFLLWYQAGLITKSSDLEMKLNELKAQIVASRQEEQKMLIDQARIKISQTLLNQHIYWSNFFALLEKYTIDEVYYKDFSAGSFENITLQAVGKDFTSVARQLVVFGEAKDFIKEVKITGGTFSPSGINFTINLTIDSALFYYQASERNENSKFSFPSER